MKFQREKCVICNKSVYVNEKVVFNGIIFHKACFRCHECKRVLTASNCSALNGVYYCKPHYKQMMLSSASSFAPPGFSGGDTVSKSSVLMTSSTKVARPAPTEMSTSTTSTTTTANTEQQNSDNQSTPTTETEEKKKEEEKPKAVVVDSVQDLEEEEEEQQDKDDGFVVESLLDDGDDEPIVESVVENEFGDDDDEEEEVVQQVVTMVADPLDEEASEDEVVEAAMTEVVHMYANDSESESDSYDSDESDSDSFEGRRPPRDVSDSGLVPVMNASAANGVTESASIRDIVQSPSTRFRVGYAETQGVRRTMEDRMSVVGMWRGCETADYFGVFDGHGGDETAHHVGENLHDVLFEHLKKAAAAGSDDAKLNFALALDNPEGVKAAMTSAFDDMQATLEAKTPPLAGGAVGVACIVLGSSLFVANCGDTRAVLILADGTGVRLTVDHKPHLPEETERIEKEGGFVTKHTSRSGVVTSRVCGALAVSRAFGDVGLQPFLIATPHVADIVDIEKPAAGEPDDKRPVALLLACDGLWDVLSENEAAALVLEHGNPEKAAIKLRNAAFVGGSTDNISVMVVHLPDFVRKYPLALEQQFVK